MGKRYAARTWSWNAGVPGGSTCGATTRPAPARVDPAAAKEKTAIARRRRTLPRIRLAIASAWCQLVVRGPLPVRRARRRRPTELDDLAGHLVDRALADVLDAVTHPLEVVRCPQKPRRAVDGARVSQHVGQQLAVDLVVQQVDLVVLRRDGPREELVLRDERIETRAEALTHERGHPRDVDEWLEEWASLVQ